MEVTTKQVWDHLHTCLLEGSNYELEIPVDDEDYVIASVQHDMKPVTWEDIKVATEKDTDFRDAMAVMKGDPTAPKKLNQETLCCSSLSSNE